MRILVVDDDRAVRESLRRSLSFNGYTVDLAEDGLEALEAISHERPDAVVLDVMMPRMDGLEVCRQLQLSGDDLPILVPHRTRLGVERVAGLDAGADDYLPKPFALEELLARLRALLRRTGPEEQTETAIMTFADLTLDPATREVHRGKTRHQPHAHRVRPARDAHRQSAPGAHPASLEEVWGFDFPPPAMRLRCTSDICVARPKQKENRG